MCWSANHCEELKHKLETNPFEAFGLSLDPRVSMSRLDAAYRELSRKVHPDQVSAELREVAQSASAALNQAYGVLRDPLQRALRLIEVRYSESLNLQEFRPEPTFLMEMLELQESIEDLQDEGQLETMEEQLESRREDSLNLIADLLQSSELKRDALARHIASVRYFQRAIKRIEEKLDE